MNRTGKNLTFSLSVLGWLILFLPAVQAQDFTLETSLSEDQVFIGEQFTLQIEVKGNSLRSISLPEIPRIEGLRLLNSTPSRGQSISIVNGQTTTVTSYTYTFIARESGSFQIPPADITIDGEEYKTEPLHVEVIEQRSLQAEEGARRPDIFTLIELNDEEPIVGQQLIASLVVYFKSGIEITSYQPSPGWRTDGFWKEQLENTEQPQAETVILGDVRYRKATLLRYALFPSRSGELTLTPFELNLGVRTRPTRNDPFGSVFGGLGTNQRTVTLESEQITLPVQRLTPPEDATTIGAVGRFDINRRASVTSVSVGESIELTTTVSGQGNLPLINKPDYDFPDSFEVYSPQEETDLNRRGMTIRGTRTFTDRFVPRSAGTYSIPEKQIAIYNPEIRDYEYQVLPAFTFEVTRDPTEMVADSDGDGSIQLLTGGAIWTEAVNRSTLNSPWLWAGILLPLFALGIAWRRRQLNLRLSSDNEFARAHHAWDNVEETLLEAENYTNGSASKEVYQLLHKAITGYITDRTGLPVAGLSDHEICSVVSDKTDRPELAGELKKTLEKCSNISYAPVENPKDIEADIDRTRELLRNLRAEL